MGAVPWVTREIREVYEERSIRKKHGSRLEPHLAG